MPEIAKLRMVSPYGARRNADASIDSSTGSSGSVGWLFATNITLKTSSAWFTWGCLTDAEAFMKGVAV